MRRLARPRTVVAGGFAAALLVGGWAAYARAADDTARYRTTLVTKDDVDQTLTLSGTIAQSGRDDLSFATSGTVSKVTVSTGDTVSAGQVLARLDRTALRAAVTKARADVAAAKAQLESDEEAQASTVTSAAGASSASSATSASAGHLDGPASSGPSGSSGAGGSGGASGSGGSGGSHGGTATTPVPPAVTAALAKLAGEQKAVTSAQSAATAALTDASQRLAAQTKACEEAFSDGGGAGTDGGSGSGAGDAADDGSGADAGAGSGGSSTSPDGAGTGNGATASGPTTAGQACTDALAAVQTAQQKVKDAQDELQQALEALGSTLDEAVAALRQGRSTGASNATPGSSAGSSTDGSAAGAGAPSSATGTAAGSTDTTAGSGAHAGRGYGTAPAADSSADTASAGAIDGSRTITAATLASDQAQIDVAEASLVKAEQALAGAVVTARRAGQVVAVDLAVGDTATAGTDVVSVVSKGTTTAQVTVASTDLPKLQVGQVASVTPAGAERGLAAKVAWISQQPDDSGATPTYSVVVTLDASEHALPSGGTASVAVAIGTAKDVVTVPTSAVHDDSVTVLDDGNLSRVRVTTGVVGPTRTEITRGLTAGQRVVLADLHEALPTGGATAPRRFDGGFGGGGFGGGFGGTSGGAGGNSPTGPRGGRG